MLTSELKEEIQTAYSSLLDAKGYRARYCQRLMIADIARVLGGIEVDADGNRLEGPNTCVVEAGTGTGKTIAYAIAAMPLAKALNKKLVISTATVALQEQIVYQDLPDIKADSGLQFSWTLAKGRRRYLCLARMDLALQEMASMNQTLALYDDEVFDVDESHRALYQQMVENLADGSWDGDRDSWSDEVDNSAWFRVSTDHVQCTGRNCSHFENCIFYRARENLHKVDVIVTNHDLVLSDLVMGGGTVLPAPEESIYVFDEGHHLPPKAVNHFSGFFAVTSTRTWVTQIPATLKQLCAELGELGRLPSAQMEFESAVNDLDEQLAVAMLALQQFEAESSQGEFGSQFRFTRGKVTPDLQECASQVCQTLNRFLGMMDGLYIALEDRSEMADPSDRERCEHWLPILAAIVARLESGLGLWQRYATADSEETAPAARWLHFRDAEIQMNASPIDVASQLSEMLWQRAFGCVITSATLSVGGDFTRFRKQAGINADNHFNHLPSPFNFAEQAVLSVPRMKIDPREIEEHTQMIIDLAPELTVNDRGSLFLFSSWRQLFNVYDGLSEDYQEQVLRQGVFSRSEIVRLHKERIDAGQASRIFGVASFAEGIDLPGEYCDHVIIAKIPFAVPDDPVGATLSEWIEDNGGNSFQQIMIPDAALRLVQACGRLLRTEEDRGRITILDRRLLTQRYGQTLLNALPPFRREFDRA